MVSRLYISSSLECDAVETITKALGDRFDVIVRPTEYPDTYVGAKVIEVRAPGEEKPRVRLLVVGSR